VVQSLRKHSKAFFDCHLMVTNPQQWIKVQLQAPAAAAAANIHDRVPGVGLYTSPGQKPSSSILARLHPAQWSGLLRCMVALYLNA
jgi:hypothetical protein